MLTSSLILPGDPEFSFTLATAIPLDWRNSAKQQAAAVSFVADCNSGLLRPATQSELTDYLYGGEYDERMDLIDGLADSGDDLTDF